MGRETVKASKRQVERHRERKTERETDKKGKTDRERRVRERD